MMEAKQSGRAKVLLVEDEALISEMIGEALSDSGFQVCKAANANQALEHLAEGFEPDVLFGSWSAASTSRPPPARWNARVFMPRPQGPSGRGTASS